MVWAARMGAVLFTWRGVVPVPLVAGLALAARPAGLPQVVASAVLVAAGLAVRLWAVAHITSRSRTRGPDVGSLVTSGPYALSRNPLYVGALVVWGGVGTASGHALAAAIALALMAAHYSLIVRWEEGQVLAAHPDAYPRYRASVARWAGRKVATTRVSARPGAWRAAWRSERATRLTTLVAWGVVFGTALVRGALAS